MKQHLALQSIYLETPIMLKYKELLVILSASILPLYLSMFRYKVFGATLRAADLICAFVIFATLLIFPKFYLKFLQFKYLPMWLLLAYILVQGIFLNNTFNSVKESIQLFWVCVYLGISSVYAQWDSKRFFKWMLIFLAVSAAFTILVHFSQGQFIRYKLAADGKYVFGLLSVLLLLRAEDTNNKRDYLYFVFSLIPLILSMERKGMVGVVFIVLLVVIFRTIKSKPILKGIPIFFGMACLLFLPYFISLAGHFVEEKIYSNYFLDESLAYFTSNIHRESLLINSYQIIRDNLFFGVGADKITEYMASFYFDPRLINGAHNFYVDTLVKYGTVGLSIFLAWIIVLTLSHRATNSFSSNLVLLNMYCLFVVTFMADGQAVLVIFLFSFLNPYLFVKS